MGNDCRVIDKEKLLKFFIDGGEIHSVVEFVRANDELELCFRGNNTPQYVCIYYKNHIAFRISAPNGRVKVEISANHARYTDKKIWKTNLNNIGLSDLKVTAYKKGEGFSSSGYITIDAKGFSSEDWQNVWENIKPLMDDYFDPEKNVDFFKKEIGRTIKKKKPDYLEKQAQQRLFSAWNNMNSEYYLYDLEYMQKGDKELNKNKPDALALRMKDGKAEAFVLVEVKSKVCSIGGKSGLKNHIKGMKEFIVAANNNGIIENRADEVIKVIEEYKDLKLRNITHLISEEEKNKILKNQEIIIIFTDDAYDEYKNNEIFKEEVDSILGDVKLICF